MKASHLVIGALVVHSMAVTVLTQQAVSDRAAVLKQTRAYALEFRAGQSDAAPKAVALAEAATTAHPNDAALWNALSEAHFLQASAAGQASGNPLDAFPHIERAQAASERALALAPDDPNALAGHGAALIFGALFQQKPALLRQAVAEMNRAVTLAPDATTPHLTRAFFTIGLPAPMRNADDIAADLRFLTTVAEGGRAGDHVHLLLGDLYAEGGRLEDARAEYMAAARRPASTAREQSAGRLAALARGGVPAGDIATLRGQLGSNCIMFHAN
jgi:hypothetical protein